MSLIQLTLKNSLDKKIKDLFLEINLKTKFMDIINKSQNILGNQLNINTNKILINNNIYFDFINNTIMDFIIDNNIDYYELDDIEFVMFVDIDIPNLLSHSYFSQILKKHI
jgi:hypothetical protein